ncbi:MAG: DUF1501 domain-containing protein [Myxococcota bacterium]|nr:DUF1501 domain-containing protein [Myxococcota bacterium]
MKRRQFMKLSAAAGLSLLAPNARYALAAEELRGFGGPFWVTINLAGAWDTTLFCDPKGNQLTTNPAKGPINLYHPDTIESVSVGNTTLRLGPGGPAEASMYYVTPSGGGAPVHIVDALAQRGLTILNGIDAGLTNHRSGEQLAMAGSTKANFPTLAALAAYERLVDREDRPAPNGPMPLISFGGYDGTANLVPVTRLAAIDVLGQITQPNVIGIGDRKSEMHSARTLASINRFLDRRRAEHEAQVLLPSRAQAMSQLFVARSKEHHVSELLRTDFDFATFESLSSFRKQIYVALRAFKGGLAASSNLLLGGWDTHQLNDNPQRNRLRILFDGLNYLKEQADHLGVTEQLNIVVGSDFGRTTYYNGVDNHAGKDHHSVTSWMTMLWAENRDSGLRVVGQTNDMVEAEPLRADLSVAQANEAGTVMTPGIIHNELRRIAGLDGSTIAGTFPISAPPLSLWA